MLHRGKIAVMKSILQQQIDSLRKRASDHLQTLDQSRINIGFQMKCIDSAMEALQAFTLPRNMDGSIRLYVPPVGLGDTIEAHKVANLFEHPMLSVVVAEPPIQIMNNYVSNGDFPFNGNDLFR